MKVTPKNLKMINKQKIHGEEPKKVSLYGFAIAVIMLILSMLATIEAKGQNKVIGKGYNVETDYQINHLIDIEKPVTWHYEYLDSMEVHILEYKAVKITIIHIFAVPFKSPSAYEYIAKDYEGNDIFIDGEGAKYRIAPNTLEKLREKAIQVIGAKSTRP